MEPWFGVEEKTALSEYMDEGGFITEFRRTEEFERAIAAFTGAEHCIVVNNGTVSLTLAALALGIRPGDEVIVPNYTMIATANSIAMLGAKPVFVDVEPTTLCLDISLAASAMTEKTRAIFFVSANGRYPSAGIEAFSALANERGVALVEDAAQALGSFYPDERHVGRAGVMGSFSFSAPKIISTGQGGALITDDATVAARLRRLKDFGRARGGLDVHDTIGYNFKFTELQACVGIEQMKKLPARIHRKKEIHREYQRQLQGVDEVHLFKHDLERTVPWFIDAMVTGRDGLQQYLKDRGIGSRTMYPPMNRQKAYGVGGSFPVSENVGQHGLWLPSSNQLSNDDIHRVCAAVRDYYGR
jgi:perosamine synthetase